MPPGHLDGEQLEQYAMDTTPEADLAHVEEHLLICPECQDALSQTDAYVGAMRAAARQIRQEEKRPSRAFFPSFVWTGALAAAAVTVFAVGLSLRSGPGTPVAVSLESTRGSVFAQAPAGRSLALVLDPGDLPVSARYRVTIVDEGGRDVWEGPAARSDSRLTAVGPRLSSGRYYVRLYSASHELLREYGVDTSARR